MSDSEQDHYRVGAAGQRNEGGVEQRHREQTKRAQRDEEIRKARQAMRDLRE